jgi:aspartyl-tRNA(Asn)/glutamyl-tRNA(Gln) amidotransferase subunit B
VRATLPELPDAKKQRFIDDYGLKSIDAETITASRAMAEYFEQVLSTIDNKDPRLVANWLIGEVSGALNRDGIEIEQSPVSAEMLGQMLLRILDNTISGKIAKEVFEAMWQGEGSADEVIETRGLKQVTDTGAIEALVDEVIASNPKQVENYLNAEESKRGKMIGFFVGQIMKASKGKANPGMVNELLKKKLVKD